ncbi:MAG TPA: hypothetical protein VG942_17485 [Hyphomonadaceae bacterium]|nr:hypothetical protein [Hyphomonadaceae bacterium]
MVKTVGEWTPRSTPPAGRTPMRVKTAPSPRTATPKGPSPKSAVRYRPSSTAAAPAAILSQVKQGERLLWSSRGSGLYIVNFQRAVVVIFILMLVLGLIIGAIVSADPTGFAFSFALVMTFAILARAILSPMFDAYAVTSRRIIVAKGIWPNFTTSYFPERINTLTLRGVRNKGSLTFFTLPAARNTGAAFHGIDRPREVAQLIHDTLAPQVRIDDRMA